LGAAGGPGIMGRQITRAAGGRPVAAVSDPAKKAFCLGYSL
jgi:hypothetical protein